MNERPLVITKHAVEAYARRSPQDPRARVLAEHNWRLNIAAPLEAYKDLEAEIRDCVREALASGITLDYRPAGFVLYGNKAGLPTGQRFVQCDRQSRYGFILKRTDDEGDIVVTTLTKVGIR